MSRRGFAPGRARGDDGKAFPLPPALARLPPGRHRLPRQFVEQDQRNRILLGALNVFAEKGFAAATVQDLITEASLARATFYKHFADKEACLLALHDEVLAWLGEEARDAAGAGADWPGAVRSVSERIVQLLADDPRIVRLCAIEAPMAGPGIRSRHEVALGTLAAALRKGRSERPWGRDLPRVLEELLLSGALSLLAGTIGGSHERSVGSISRELPEILLIPYLGVEDARSTTEGAR